jgi:tetratricopeptide (TPR) repeat protein
VVTREAWTDALAKAPSQKLYETYLELRPTFIDATGYYLDVADALIAVGQPERALRVLSSLAELQGEDSRTLRILAHRLMQLKRADLAVMVFEDVKRVRDEEPQSYRDLGLALAACGRYNDAVDQFLYVIEHPWHNRFPEIEMIAAREMARIAEDKGVNKQRIDTNYLIPFRNDVRVVLTWDADNCDMDLWVTDPNGETCKYNNRNTVLGGRMSRDLTGGYGPEEFTLPNAKKGAYKIQVHYYGDRQQNLARPTTVQVEMYARYGTKSEAHDAVTMRLDGVSRVIDIGTILVN